MDGKKAYVLPAVAALVLLVLFALRSQTEDPPAAPPSETAVPGATGPGARVPKGTKAKIREAIAAAGDPTLDASAAEALREALQPVIGRCRAARPDAEAHVSVTLEVIAAKDVGVRIERATLPDGHPADLVGCIREGLLGAKPDDIGQTGRLTTTLEFGTS